jgi:hypothetical protein
MANRFLSVALMAITALVLATTMLVVDIVVAFRPLALVGRNGQIGSASSVSRKRDIKHLTSLTTGCSSTHVSQFQMKSVGNDDDDHQDKDVVLVQNNKVDALLALLDSVPRNLPTSKSLTDQILNAVQQLEEDCPTSDESVLSELSGNWELLWTAQDRSSEQYIKGGLANRFINPLENQSYSNNPFRRNNPDSGGRANPVLPREIQDVLERTGIIEASGGSGSSESSSKSSKTIAPIRSSQGIDLKRKRVRNVVNVQIKKPFSVKGSLIVDVNFKPNIEDKRRIDVKFDSCRFILKKANLNQKFPLGVFGPTGWLRTVYIDDRIRITRGHKGSVFILSRTAERKSV